MTRRKDGLYQQGITINGKRKYFYGRSKAEVLKKINEYREDQERGRMFPDVADEWWEEHEPTLSPITFKSYVPAIRRAKQQFVCPIKQIKAADINQYIRGLAHQGYAQKTVKTHLMVVNLICKYAVQYGYMELNPAREIEVPKGLKKAPRALPSSTEINIIKTTTNEEMGMFAYWVLYTGLRRSELLALTWEDVDMSERLITVNKSRYQVNNKTYLKEPKSEAGYRIVPIPDKLYERLKKGKGIIFPDQNGGLMTEKHFENHWNRYRKKYGLQCTPHALRHCYATMLYEHDINVKDAQELLGHAQASTTQDIYTHLREQRKSAVRNALHDVDLV